MLDSTSIKAQSSIRNGKSIPAPISTTGTAAQPQASPSSKEPPLYYNADATEDAVVTSDNRRVSWDALFPTLPASPRRFKTGTSQGEDGKGHSRQFSDSKTKGGGLAPVDTKRPSTSPAMPYERQTSWMRDEEAMSIRSSSSASSSVSSHSDRASFSIAKPTRPSKSPFLPKTDSPNCSIVVDDQDAKQYRIQAHLPGFLYEHITVALKRTGNLHILADRFEESPLPSGSKSETYTDKAGHFERMVELGPDSIGSQAKASWSGETLTVTVTRRPVRENVQVSRD